jgi:hypothetical protein
MKRFIKLTYYTIDATRHIYIDPEHITGIMKHIGEGTGIYTLSDYIVVKEDPETILSYIKSF